MDDDNTPNLFSSYRQREKLIMESDPVNFITIFSFRSMIGSPPLIDTSLKLQRHRPAVPAPKQFPPITLSPPYFPPTYISSALSATLYIFVFRLQLTMRREDRGTLGGMENQASESSLISLHLFHASSS